MWAIPRRSRPANLAPLIARRRSVGAESAGIELSPVSGAALGARERMLAALIARTSRGDRAALEALYDETSALVYSVALRILRDAECASEVVVDVFARLVQRAATYDPARGSATTWLVMQTRTLAIDRYRVEARTRGREIALTVEMENELPAGTEDGAEMSARRELQRVIRAAIASLTAPQRRVIEVAFYSGLSQSEIAALLGEPLGTVKTRIRTAMRRLRDLLGPALEELRP